MAFTPENLYEEMLDKISEKSKQPNKSDLIESCYWIASKYWESLKKEINLTFFNDQAREIKFFRNTKPMFTSQVQYYSMLAEAQLFVPDDIDAQIEYWRNELKRYRRFCERFSEFVDYYDSKAVYLDSIYFVKVSPDWIPAYQPVTYDSDKNFCSTHDHLVRGLLAHRMYHAYVQEKLNLVKNEL